MLSPPWLTDSTTPDAGIVENYTAGGSELYWEFDEERGRYYVSYPEDQ